MFVGGWSGLCAGLTRFRGLLVTRAVICDRQSISRIDTLDGRVSRPDLIRESAAREGEDVAQVAQEPRSQVTPSELDL